MDWYINLSWTGILNMYVLLHKNDTTRYIRSFFQTSAFQIGSKVAKITYFQYFFSLRRNLELIMYFQFFVSIVFSLYCVLLCLLYSLDFGCFEFAFIMFILIA